MPRVNNRRNILQLITATIFTSAKASKLTKMLDIHIHIQIKVGAISVT